MATNNGTRSLRSESHDSPVHEARPPTRGERGSAVLLDDMIDCHPEPKQHSLAPRAVRAVLVGYADNIEPALLLQDGTVLLLGWSQTAALASGLQRWLLAAATYRSPKGPPLDASWSLPT